MLEPVEGGDWDADDRLRDGRAGARHPLFWPAWLWPLLAWLPLDAWHARFVREVPELDAVTLAGVHASPAALAWAATAFVLAAALAEAGFYGMLWAARGRRLPFAATTVAVLQAGGLELMALRLTETAGTPAPAWVVLLAGARSAGATGVTGAFAAAFGGAGLLALARVALFAGLQAGLARVPWREALALVAATWLASHVAWWWVAELLQGRSVFR